MLLLGISEGWALEPIPQKTRNTFIEFRESEQKEDISDLLKLYSTNATIVLIDANQNEVKLSLEEFSELAKFITKEPQEENILYDSLKISRSKGTDTFTFKGIRENTITKRSAPFYLEIEGDKIIHHAWEPVYEIDTQSLNTSLNTEGGIHNKLKNLDFKDIDQTNLPPLSLPTQNGYEGLEEEKEIDETITSQKSAAALPTDILTKKTGSVKALRVQSKDSLSITAKRFQKHLEKEYNNSSFSKIKEFSPPLSGTTVDPRNMYNILLIRTDAFEDKPKVWALAAKLARSSSNSDEIIIVYNDLELPQTPEGEIQGETINKGFQQILSELYSIDSLSIKFWKF